ncbi:hypothetical protein DRO26_03310 [Candidatus Bathyarchaeota archaeon]|nr:MAG: hypothetical protein DRO26_03310 [Candidatus Bathyarchaeota archaeon]
MLTETSLTVLDFAKYPFTVEAAKYIEKKLGKLGLEELLNPNYKPVLDRAFQRIKESVLTPLKQAQFLGEEIEVEILSFPLAIIMMKAIPDPYFQKRFALFEAKKASASLEKEDEEKIVEIAKRNFNWKISIVNSGSSKTLKLHFTNYLKNASKLHEDKWKLVNRNMEYGDIYLTKTEAARLLEEEIKSHIQSKFEEKMDFELPETILNKIEELKTFFQEQRKKLPAEEPLGKTEVKAFPPCIKNLYMDVLAGKNVSHIGRFTLTAFLIQIGMPPEDIIKLYSSATDFDERITKYQVEHIAGLVGGKTKYKPLNCQSMQTHGLCVGRDDLCSKIKNPMTYYKKAKKQTKVTR